MRCNVNLQVVTKTRWYSIPQSADGAWQPSSASQHLSTSICVGSQWFRHGSQELQGNGTFFWRLKISPLIQKAENWWWSSRGGAWWEKIDISSLSCIRHPLPVCLFYLSISLLNCLPVYICLPVYTVCLSIGLSVYMSDCLPVCLCFCLSVYLFVCRSVCPSILYLELGLSWLA